MCDKNGPCTNVQFGFDCMKKWERDHPGKNAYHCEFCGIYAACKPRCNMCHHSRSDEEVNKDQAKG